MLSQDNITWIIQASQSVFNWSIDSEDAVSYLPLSHIAAQIIDIYLCCYGGATVWFADRTALQVKYYFAASGLIVPLRLVL